MQFNEKRDFLATRRSNLLTQLDIERSKNGSFEISKHEIIDSVKSLVKNLNHIDTGKNLDGRM